MSNERTADDIEASLRKNGPALAADFAAARAAGLHVVWPGTPEGLAALEISGTAVSEKAAAEEPVATGEKQPAPQPAAGPQSSVTGIGAKPDAGATGSSPAKA